MFEKKKNAACCCLYINLVNSTLTVCFVLIRWEKKKERKKQNPPYGELSKTKTVKVKAIKQCCKQQHNMTD